MKGSSISLTPFFSLRCPAVSLLVSLETGGHFAGTESTEGYEKKSKAAFDLAEQSGPELKAEVAVEGRQLLRKGLKAIYHMCRI